MSDVSLRITANGAELRKDIDLDIKALKGFANVVDVTNKTAVRAFRESAAAQRELMAASGATGKQFVQLDAVTRGFERNVNAAGNSVDRINPKARSAANAMNMLAFASTGAGGSMQGAVVAIGSMTEGLAVMSKNAKLAASASGIGALAVALGVFIALAAKAKDAMNTTITPDGVVGPEAKRHIENLRSLAAAQRELNAAREQANRATAAVKGRGDEAGVQTAVNASAKVEALQAKVLELKAEAAETAKRTAIEAAASVKAGRGMSRGVNSDIDAMLAAKEGSTAARRQVIEQTAANELATLKEMNLVASQRAEIEEAIGNKRTLALRALEQEVKLANERVAAETRAGSDSPLKAHQGRLELIEIEKAAAIKAGIDVKVAEERANQQKLQLNKAYLQSYMSRIKAIEDATINSKNREVRAIGMAAKVARRLEIGWKGADALVDSAKQAAKVPGFIAAGQFGSAALAGISSVQHAAAAALAFQEAGGGGGGKAGGGGGGGGGGGMSATDPRESSRLGSSLGASRGETIKIEMLVIKQDMDGKELSRARQDLQRRNDRNQPIRMSV